MKIIQSPVKVENLKQSKEGESLEPALQYHGTGGFGFRIMTQGVLIKDKLDFISAENKQLTWQQHRKRKTESGTGTDEPGYDMWTYIMLDEQRNWK